MCSTPGQLIFVIIDFPSDFLFAKSVHTKHSDLANLIGPNDCHATLICDINILWTMCTHTKQ